MAKVVLADVLFARVLVAAPVMNRFECGRDGGFEFSQVLFVIEVAVVGALELDLFAAVMKFHVVGVPPFEQDIHKNVTARFGALAGLAHAVAFRPGGLHEEDATPLVGGEAVQGVGKRLGGSGDKLPVSARNLVVHRDMRWVLRRFGLRS